MGAMEYIGAVYARINGKYIECTETIEDLENKIKSLEGDVKFLRFLVDNGISEEEFYYNDITMPNEK